MIYMYCSSCKKITAATENRGTFSSSVVCDSCAGKHKTSEFTTHPCPDCGVTLYAPKSMDYIPACPCQSVLTVGAMEEPAEEIKPEKPAHPPILCPRCQATLTSEDGTYGPCPMCREIPSRLYVSQQLYLLSGDHGPIMIKWDPKPNEMVYLHHHASHIPLNSVLIVDPNQQAAYISGGQMAVLDAGQTYAMFNDELDIATIAKALSEDALALPPLRLKLNSKVIFFDSRKHEVPFTVESSVSESSWKVELPAAIDVQVCNPECLLRNALDLREGDSVSDFLQRKAMDAVLNEIIDELLFIPKADAEEATTEMQLKRLLRDTLADQEQKILNRANRRLTEKYGITVAYLDISYRDVRCTRG